MVQNGERPASGSEKSIKKNNNAFSFGAAAFAWAAEDVIIVRKL